MAAKSSAPVASGSITDIRKADLLPLGAWAARTAADALADEGLNRELVGRLDPGSVVTAKTASRRILGIMNDMALHIQYAVYDEGGLRTLDVAALNHKLRRTLYQVRGRYDRPVDLARGLADLSA